MWAEFFELINLSEGKKALAASNSAMHPSQHPGISLRSSRLARATLGSNLGARSFLVTESVKARWPLVMLCMWCIVLLWVRHAYSASVTFDFLVWNLFLAVVPVMAAMLLRMMGPKRVLSIGALVLFAVWLAYLPNAPYLVTDLVHLRERAPVPLWFDVVMLGSFAGTGLLLAYVSVADVEAVIKARFGVVWAAVVAYGALALCGFGIYLGRFLRMNSWDLLGSPLTLAGQVGSRVADPLSHQRTWGVTVLYAAALILGYVALKGVAKVLVSDVED